MNPLQMENRVRLLSAVVREAGADAGLLTSDVLRTYATGTTALEGQCLIFADDTAEFVTDGRYLEAAERLLSPLGFQVLLWRRDGTRYAHLQQLLTAHNVQTLLYEDDEWTVQRFAALQKAISCNLQPLGDRIHQLRMKKSAAERAAILGAQRIAEHAFAVLLTELWLGMTERQAAARLEYLMAMGGSEGPSFQTILLFGAKTSMPHGVPDENPLRAGDCVTADFGATLHGYHSDMTRTFVYGGTAEQAAPIHAVYDIVLAAQAAAVAKAKAGLLCKEMHEAAAEVIAQAGYGAYFPHALGHSVGLEIHERPFAAPDGKTVLENDMVLTVEPGIYLPERFGIRIEDMVVICDETPECLTRSPKAFCQMEAKAAF